MKRRNAVLFVVLAVFIAGFSGLFAQSGSEDELKNITSTNRPFREMQKLTLTVGLNEGDLQGNDDKVIQAGMEYLNRLGGGILQILPGTYEINNAIYVRPNVTIRGSGEKTILKKSKGFVTPIVRDADWFEYAVQVKDPSGFSSGCGIMLCTKPEKPGQLWAMDVMKGTVTKIAGDVIFFDKITGKDFWLEKECTAANIFPIITAENVNDITIEDIVLDGNREENELVNGNFSGGIFLEHCNGWNFSNVTVRNYNGDGYSWQVCNDMHFKNCKSLNNGGLGFHPGSGSQRPVFKECISKGNDQGIYFCWSVTKGIAKDCILSDNVKYGISIGHRDTDNIIKNCTIENNGQVGIIFRKGGETEFFGGHRNIIDNCTIRDNGGEEDGFGIDIQYETYDITINSCEIGNINGQKQKTGIRIGHDAQNIVIEKNKFINTPVEVDDLRKH